MWPRRTYARLTALLALAIPGIASAVHLDYEVGLGIEHDDNVNLSENDPISDNILIPTLAFTVSELGSTVQANATGAIEYRDYLDNTFGDEFRGELTGRLNWNMLPERLDFVVQDRLALEPINTLTPDAPNNLQQTNVLALGPVLSFRLAPTWRGQAEIFLADSRAQETDDFNSERILGAVRAIKDLDPTSSISANLADERATFDDSSTSPDYNRYGVFGRYKRKWSKVDLTTDLGYSWLAYSSISGFDRDSPILRTDLAWEVAPRSTLGLHLAYEFSDAATDLLTDIGTPPAEGYGGTPRMPTDVVIGGATITSAPYLEKRIDMSYAYRTERLEFIVDPYYRKYDYGAITLEEFGAVDQSAKGGLLGVIWRLTPLVSTGANATFENINYDTLSRTDRNRYYTLYLRHQWARHWSWHAELTRNERHSTEPGLSSDEDIVFVGLTYTR